MLIFLFAFYILAFTLSEGLNMSGILFFFFSFFHLGYQCSPDRNSLHSYQLPYFCPKSWDEVLFWVCCPFRMHISLNVSSLVDIYRDFPGGIVTENLPASAGDTGRFRFDPWIGKITWRREWQPTLVFLPGEFHGQRSMVGYSPWDRRQTRLSN